MPNRGDKRTNRQKRLPPWLPLEALIILLFFVVLIWLSRAFPAQAGADQSASCSVDVELEVLSDIVITDVESNGYFGSIYYETSNKGEDVLDLGQGRGGRMLPMKIRVNDRSVRLSDLRGAAVSSMKATRKDCTFSHPVIGSRPLSQQWTIRVDLSL